MRNFVKLGLFGVLLSTQFATAYAKGDTAVTSLLLSESTRTVFEDELEFDAGWVSSGTGGEAVFENSGIKISWSAGSESIEPADFLATLPINYIEGSIDDEITLTVVVTSAGGGVGEPGSLSIADHTLAFGNIKMSFGFGVLIPNGTPYQFPLVIKLNYDLSSSQQVMRVNNVIPFGGGNLTVETDYAGPSYYSIKGGTGLIPTGIPDIGFVAVDSILLETLKD